MPVGKISQPLYVLLLKEIVKNVRWKSQSNPKRSAGYEYAAVDVSSDSPKAVFEF